jgi:mannitol/fructose-specific phosphotransferase system IIA component (Ntr-type)
MRLDKIIARSRIIDLRSLTLEAALGELLDVCIAKFPDLKRESILKGLLARESTMTTYLGLGVALPHVRVKTSRRYILAIGRSRAGMRHHGAMSGERVHLIVMLIAGESARDTLQVLASIGRLVREQELVDSFVHAPDLDTLYERLLGGFGGMRPIQAQQNRVNRLMFRQAELVAQGRRLQRDHGLRRHLHRGDRAGGPAAQAQDDPGHPQPHRAGRGREQVHGHDPGPLLLEPADGAAAQRAPRRAHPRPHLLQRQDLLRRRDHREQPVRHDRGRGDRARVPDAALGARPPTSCPRT